MIGCGSVTEVKSGPGLQKAEGSALVAVMRRNGELAADYALRHGVPKWYDDAQALINDPEVDAVYIATHPDTHYAYTLMVAQSGKPVYCEKPLGMSYGQSKEMVEYCKQHAIPFFSAYYRRALPKYRMIKEILESGRLGKVRAVHILMQQAIKDEDRKNGGTWRVRPEVSGGGKFHDVGSHALDLIDWFFGPVIEAKGEGLNQSKVYAADDMVHGYFKTEQGVAGTGIWCFDSFRDEDTTTIHLQNGDLSYSVLDIAAPITITTNEGIEVINVPSPPQHVAQPLIQTVVDELLGRGTCPSTGESGMRTDYVLDCLSGKR
jgi:predicted dehydrogenase